MYVCMYVCLYVCMCIYLYVCSAAGHPAEWLCKLLSGRVASSRRARGTQTCSCYGKILGFMV